MICGKSLFMVQGQSPFGPIGTYAFCLLEKGHAGEHAPLPDIKATRGGIRFTQPTEAKP